MMHEDGAKATTDSPARRLIESLKSAVVYGQESKKPIRITVDGDGFSSFTSVPYNDIGTLIRQLERSELPAPTITSPASRPE